MAMKIKIRRSATPGAVPAAALAADAGVISTNTADRKIYIVGADGAQVLVSQLLGLYDAARVYAAGDLTINSNRLYRATVPTTGAFTPAAWQEVAGAASGPAGALLNAPDTDTRNDVTPAGNFPALRIFPNISQSVDLLNINGTRHDARGIPVGRYGEAVFLVAQPAHSFTIVGQPAAWNGTSWVRAGAGIPASAVIHEVIDTNNFLLQQGGQIKNLAPSLFAGGAPAARTNYYLSRTVLGQLTSVASSGSQLILRTAEEATRGAVFVQETLSLGSGQTGATPLTVQGVGGQTAPLATFKYSGGRDALHIRTSGGVATLQVDADAATPSRVLLHSRGYAEVRGSDAALHRLGSPTLTGGAPRALEIGVNGSAAGAFFTPIGGLVFQDRTFGQISSYSHLLDLDTNANGLTAEGTSFVRIGRATTVADPANAGLVVYRHNNSTTGAWRVNADGTAFASIASNGRVLLFNETDDGTKAVFPTIAAASGQPLHLRVSASEEVAVYHGASLSAFVESAGTSVASTLSVVTVQKGDARYLRTGAPSNGTQTVSGRVNIIGDGAGIVLRLYDSSSGNAIRHTFWNDGKMSAAVFDGSGAELTNIPAGALPQPANTAERLRIMGHVQDAGIPASYLPQPANTAERTRILGHLADAVSPDLGIPMLMRYDGSSSSFRTRNSTTTGNNLKYANADGQDNGGDGPSSGTTWRCLTWSQGAGASEVRRTATWMRIA